MSVNMVQVLTTDKNSEFKVLNYRLVSHRPENNKPIRF